MSDVPAIDGYPHVSAPDAGARRRLAPAVWRRGAVTAMLAASDAASALLAVALMLVLVAMEGAPIPLPSVPTLLVLSVLLVCLHRLLGLYEDCRASPVELFRLRVFAAIVFTAFIAATADVALGPSMQLLDGALLIAIVVAVGAAGAALARSLLIRLGLWQAPVLLFGPADSTARLAAVLDADPRLGMRAVGQAGEPAEIAILIESGDRQKDLRAAAALDVPRVIIARDAGDMQTLWLHTRTVGDAVGIELRRFLVARNLIFKRAFDLGVAGLLAVPAAPLVLCLALAVWSVDRQGPFYAQTRIGREGRPVRVWKLRSMYVDAEARLEDHLRANPKARAEWERCFKLTDDPRILPGIGRFIRRSSLDELPQLWNVLRGDMSLVGPRPFPAYHLASFDEDFRRLRASVVPGLTGLWQIGSRSDGDLAVQKSLDSYYIRNWSVWLDLYILLHTLPAVLFARGAR